MNILRWYDIIPLAAATAAVVITMLWNRRKKASGKLPTSNED